MDVTPSCHNQVNNQYRTYMYDRSLLLCCFVDMKCCMIYIMTISNSNLTFVFFLSCIFSFYLIIVNKFEVRYITFLPLEKKL